MFVESQDSNIFNDQGKCSCESSTNPLHSWLRKFNEENCFDDENELENESKLDWWSKVDVNRVFLSQEENVDNQFLDIRDIDHSDLDNLETPFSMKTNKSAEERKCCANDAYNEYFYKSNIMID